MGRRRSEYTIELAKRVYALILESDGEASTPALFSRALEEGLVSEYSSLYRVLRFLEERGLVDRRIEGKVCYWEVSKVFGEEELEALLG